jgi:RHS repeat-associated protein
MGTFVGTAPTVPGAPTEQYVYDHLYRLTNVKTAANANIESYTYNGTGDRLSKTVGGQSPVDYAYPVNSHLLMGIGASARSYDPNGNLLSDDSSGATMEYDARSRLVSRSGFLFDYNGRGERILKTNASGDADYSYYTQYVYDESGTITSEIHSSFTENCGDIACLSLGLHEVGNIEYVWMDGLPIGVSFNGTMYNVEADHLDTPRKVRDPQRNVTIWSSPFQGNPFGEASVNEDPDGDGTSVVYNLRFAGQFADSESGMNYNYFRDYEPSTGRYVESDPIGLRGDISTYAYVGGRPINQRDRYGLRVNDSGFIQWDSTCDECRKHPTNRKLLDDALTRACSETIKQINDSELLYCLKMRCKHSVIECGDCNWKFIWRFPCGSEEEIAANPMGFKIRYCYKNRSNTVGENADLIVHELSHSCGWPHYGGMGVPNQEGRIGPIDDRCKVPGFGVPGR